jgi:protein TonB
LDKARRVRPEHAGLAALDTQLRGELRKILVASTAAPPVETLQIAKLKASNGNPVSARVATNRRNSESVRHEAEPSPATPTPLPEVAAPAATLASIALLPTVVAPTSSAIAETPQSKDSADGAGPSVDSSPTVTDSPAVLPEPAPTAVPSAEPKLIKMVQPTYPQEALIRGVEGWVEVSLQVTAAGNVVAPRVETTSRGRLFNRAALAAVEQWKYEPRGDGAPTQTLRVRLQFRQSN